MTAGPAADPRAVDAFTGLLLGMSYADADAAPLLDLEGLSQWVPARVSGYAALEDAVDESGFYDSGGKILAAGYLT